VLQDDQITCPAGSFKTSRGNGPVFAGSKRQHIDRLPGQSPAQGYDIEGNMRFIQAILLLAFLGAVGLFAVQNTEAITVNFWTWKASGPVALLTIAAYLLGMVSGWTVVSFFTRSLHRVSERSTH
jgi:lipopolysaccharide assembly protein A